MYIMVSSTRTKGAEQCAASVKSWFLLYKYHTDFQKKKRFFQTKKIRATKDPEIPPKKKTIYLKNRQKKRMLQRFKTNSFKSFLQAVTAPKFRGSTGLKCRFGVLGGAKMITENTHVPGPLSYLILCLCKDMDVWVYIYIYMYSYSMCWRESCLRFLGNVELRMYSSVSFFHNTKLKAIPFWCLQGRWHFSCSYRFKISWKMATLTNDLDLTSPQTS